MIRRDFLKKSAAAGGAIIYGLLPDVPAQAALPAPDASAWVVTPQVPGRVQPFDLADVHLLPSLFQQARDRDSAYLLALEPDRLLHAFRTEAGLPAKAPAYGGWEQTTLAGHSLGHYLSAISMDYRATGDPRLKSRAGYIVGELAVCQDKNGSGYVAAIPGGKAIFAELAAGNVEAPQKAWVPWYNLHKLLAGLRDAYLYTGSAQAKDVLLRLSDWVIATTASLSDDQWQTMLAQEHGGMNEVLADVYALTAEPKYLAVSHKFYSKAVLDPLTRREDRLTGLHGNMQIPTLIGLARLYELTGEPKDRIAAEFFWQQVAQHRSYAIGADTDNEHFAAPDTLSAFLSVKTAETCNTYNMLKLTRHLFEWTASPMYADFYERALYNHILASQDPVRGMMTYYVSLKPGHFKTYSSPTDSFWCCVGTGMENHVKYGDSIYFHSGDDLYVNLFIPSVLKWRAKGLTVTQSTHFPEHDTSRLTLACAHPVSATLQIRCPAWTKNMTVSVNGKPHAAAPVDGYLAVPGHWKNGDTVDITLPMHLHSEAMPDNPDQIALLYGPLVLAGQLGTDGLAPPMPYAENDQLAYLHAADPPVPVFVTGAQPLETWIKPVAGQPLTFQTVGVGRPADVTLKPFYSTYFSRYTVYWDTFTPDAWEKHQADYQAAQEKQRQLDARTVDELRPGEQQSEHDHQLQSEHSNAGDGPDGAGTHWRDASNGGEFSFVLKSLPDTRLDLICTYWGSDAGGRVFDILVDGTQIATQTLNGTQPGHYFDVVYPIDAALTAGKTQITVRFQAQPGAIAGGLFGCRLVRRV